MNSLKIVIPIFVAITIVVIIFNLTQNEITEEQTSIQFKETNEIWYRVRVGSYDNRDTAVAVAESLSSTRRERAWVDFVRYEY